MSKFEQEYKNLNTEQKKAVDTTEGPLLVIAGPGTGKTQLLSMRVANILKKSGLPAGNILCLTFTDNAARNMRERLSSIIGQAAYHVSISTFHGFGADVISQYPDYFTRRQLLQQIDELGRYELLRNIFEELPHSNPLSTKVGDQFVHLKSTLNVISWLKQNALAPRELQNILNSNQKFIEAAEGELAAIFTPTPSPKLIKNYESLLKDIKKHRSSKPTFGFLEYASECAFELEQAILATEAKGRYAKEITAWRNRWCKKDGDGNYVFKDGGQNYRKMQAVADAYGRLLDEMAGQGLYDFDDMVMESVHAMEETDELRYALQERYQYVLVDEFQDTNKAQLRMLACLGDNPVHEERPNIMAVGDDDQAIYAFQGAEASNMSVFAHMYKKPSVITLKQNYRSNADILAVGSEIARQITDRLESAALPLRKELVANKQYKAKILRHTVFPSELAQYDWIAAEIDGLVASGISPEEIAVIAPRHKYLERLMPYLGSRNLPVAYERREDILQAPIIKQLLTLAGLIVALNENRQDDIDVLISEVLGFEFWEIPDEELIKISIDNYNRHIHWLPGLLKHKNKKIRAITAWLAGLSKKSRLEPMEYMIDKLMGSPADSLENEYDDLRPAKVKKDAFVSPMRSYYFNPENYEQATDIYLSLLGQLSTLRHRLRMWKPHQTLYLKDLVEFSDLHTAANIKIIDTNPHTQTTHAVQVMTAYKAKGLEFEAVFVINAQDEVWGPTARNQSPSITLPKNLPIEPAGSSDNDKLRLLFVALTRAKHTLQITGYSHTLDNKPSPALSFFTSGEDENLPIHPDLEPILVDKPVTARAAEILSTDWAYRFRQIIASKKALFEPILNNYKLSVTHLNNFLDIKDGGPDYFLLHNLLRFPEALSPSAAYGDSVHKTLQWMQTELRNTSSLPSIGRMQDYFSDMLRRKHLKKSDQKKLDRRGRESLEVYIKDRAKDWSAGDIVERGFNNEGVVINGAHLSGKIDKLHFSGTNSIEVADFKTGKPARSWQGRDEYEKIKLHKYRQQLLFYKLLVENSASFKGRLTVKRAAVEFIETDDKGRLADNLQLEFDDKEIERFVRLTGKVWEHIQSLDFPDVSKYPKNLQGILQFEEDLLGRD